MAKKNNVSYDLDDIIDGKIQINMSKMKRNEKVYLVNLLTEYSKRIDQKGTLHKWFREGTEYSIHDYPKVKSHFKKGSEYRVRLLMGGNRSGKTKAACVETAYHALGRYPDWWEGVRMKEDKKNITIWMIADSYDSLARVMIKEMFYEEEGADFGTGLIPGERIISAKVVSAVANCFSKVRIRRDNGGICTIFFKSANAGRKEFQGNTLDFVVFDEEPSQKIYFEVLARTLTSGAKIVLAFTPLEGLTELIKEFQKTEHDPNDPKTLTRMGWDDSKHITEENKIEMRKIYPAWQMKAREFGYPILGSGAIYPFAEEQFKIEPFNIPDYFDLWYALDVGFRTTAILFFAQDPSSKIIYIYDELYLKEMTTKQYAPLIKEKLPFHRGAIDPASAGRGQRDGISILSDLTNQYKLDLTKANNSVDYGIGICNDKIRENKLKIFSKCKNLLEEMGAYRYDEEGRIVKEFDHACDAMRYGIVSGEAIKRVKTYVSDHITKSGSRSRRTNFGAF